MAKKLKLLVIGVDGASHRFMSHYMAAGKLPELDDFLAADRFRPLDTVFPPHTAPGWASLFTGVDPGEHGIYQFWSLQNENYIPRINRVTDFGWEPLWNTLERHGLSCGIYNVPMSHPPDPQSSGFQITWPLAPTIGYIHPSSLMAELVSENLHHKSDLVTMYRGQDDFADRACKEIAARRKTLKHLLKNHPCDAVIAIFTEIDRVCHYFWQSEKDAGPEILRVYQAMCKAIADIMKDIPDDTLCLVVSDHGFGHCTANIQINMVLRNAGLLKLTPNGEDHIGRQTRFLTDKAALDTDAETSWHRDSGNADLVDWEQTYAFMPAPGCFGLNLNLASRQEQGIITGSDEKNKVIATLKKIIKTLMDDHGQQIFDLIPAKDIYQGHRLNESCDLLLLPRRWDLMAHPGLTPDIWSPATQQAVHRTDGVFLAKGGNFKDLPDRLHVTDILPTCMAHLGLPVAEGVSGHNHSANPIHVRRESPLRRMRHARQHQAQQDSSEMEARLAAMGYL